MLGGPPRVYTYSAPTFVVFAVARATAVSFFTLSFVRLAPDTVGAGGRSLRDKYWL